MRIAEFPEFTPKRSASRMQEAATEVLACGPLCVGPSRDLPCEKETETSPGDRGVQGLPGGGGDCVCPQGFRGENSLEGNTAQKLSTSAGGAETHCVVDNPGAGVL
ncbi:hypothetical protein NDU88_000381 [Pleurodeles waltl]|uniref:Uncharacterized protein n=1 Tax=Pleurodeles waltl TaxID=8319 RepID=A0AAV7TEQ3_PLEWA|nr:hypothetical protein NDU88_000381 [Pleurodeles waltl]